MTVKARICEAPAANLNGARVTEAFIDEVVSNEARYVGLPLYADVKALTSGNYRRLGHLYDSKTGEFHSTQIGSFYQFEKEEFKNGEETGCYLVGYARIAKRNKKLSKAISELFADGALKFSFEVAVGEYEELDDDTILIDASESNYLEGTAIVTFPACEEAVALELVAQRKAEKSAEADDTEGGEKEMAEKEKVIEEVAEEQIAEKAAETPAEEIAEETSEKTEEVAEEAKEEVAEEETEKTAEEQEETANCKKEKAEEEAKEETAAVVVDETTYEAHSTYAYDTESGTTASQTVSVETRVSHVDPEASIVEADDGVHVAEETVCAEDDPPAGNQNDPPANPPENPPAQEEPEDTPIDVDKKAKKTAEQLIAELAEVVESLKNEIAELKEQKVVAETKTVTAEVNPLMADINSMGKYSLLQKEEKRNNSYSLLGRA